MNKIEIDSELLGDIAVDLYDLLDAVATKLVSGSERDIGRRIVTIERLLGDETKRKPEAATPPKKPDLVYTVTVPTFAGDIDRHIAALDCLLAEKFYGAEFTIKVR